jgi:hypothetical protein
MEKKLTKTDWRGHLEKAEAHPQGVKGYCREHALVNSTFHYWKKKLANPKAAPAEAFAAVEIARPADRGSKLPDPRWLAEFLLCLAGGAR